MQINNRLDQVKFIGVSGVARVGKNLFCDIAARQLKTRNIKSKIYALASEVKADCETRVRKSLGLDVYSEKTEDKKLFRDILVQHGVAKRNETQGTYWTSKLEAIMSRFMNMDKTVEIGLPGVIFISDIRFNEFEKDEVWWITEHLKGKLVHISKYEETDGIVTLTPPANKTEETNDPLVQAVADFKVSWSHIGSENLTENAYLNECVAAALDNILPEFRQA
jgi:hypothetical protein